MDINSYEADLEELEEEEDDNRCHYCGRDVSEEATTYCETCQDRPYCDDCSGYIDVPDSMTGGSSVCASDAIDMYYFLIESGYESGYEDEAEYARTCFESTPKGWHGKFPDDPDFAPDPPAYHTGS